MKILVVSDTHGRASVLESLLERHCREVQMVCHLGDCARDLLKFQSRYPSVAMSAVAGNTDYYNAAMPELFFTAAERKILLVHGHRHSVKQGLERLFFYAKSRGADICFFGHTHTPVMFTKDGIFIMNPGSLTEPRGGRASYGLVEISPEGEIIGSLREPALEVAGGVV